MLSSSMSGLNVMYEDLLDVQEHNHVCSLVKHKVLLYPVKHRLTALCQ